MGARARWQHAKSVFGPWWWGMNVAWGCLTLADTLVSKWASETFRKTWDSYWRLPKWGWKVWIIGFLCITVFFIFEASYRRVNDESETRIQAEKRLTQEKVHIVEQLAKEKEQRLKAEQLLVDEKANKLTVDEIVLREARDGFRNLTKQASTIAPREVLNEFWVSSIAEKHGKSSEEISDAIDRLDGKFHWQS